MISCDRCGTNTGEPLDCQTYKVSCRSRDETDASVHSNLVGPKQLCDTCVDIVREAIVAALHKCLIEEK